MPNHRSQEHLFTVKSVIALYSRLNIPLFLQIFDISKYFDREILKNAMDPLYKCGITGKLYRLWYNLNKDSQIKVKTAAGLTCAKTTGENVTQGSIGGAILSSANLDKTLCAYFGGSDSELSYGDRRLQPITFQDDTCRLAGSVEDVQEGNIIMQAAMKRMQLDLNIAKCSVIVFHNKKSGIIREKMNKMKHIKIANNQILAKDKDEYLGDFIHEGGLSKSVETTINNRLGRIFSSMIEVSAILDDFRIDTIGGMVAGLEIYELALLPSLLNNSDIWTDINRESINKLENLQNTMFRYLFGVPESTPLPLLRFDVGSLTMEESVHKKKLNFLFHLKSMDSESLAGEILHLQITYGFPGLVTECRTLIQMYQLPNIIDEDIKLSKCQWKILVRKAIHKFSEETLKKNFKGYSKLRNKQFEDEDLKVKDYVKTMRLRNARTNFRIRANMIKTKMNMKNDRNYANKLWKCDDCQSMDSQAHIVWCPVFAPLREGKDLKSDTDLVNYYQQVMKIREDREKNSS